MNGGLNKTMAVLEYYNAKLLQEAWNSANTPIGKYIILEDFINDDPKPIVVKKDTLTGKPVGHAIFQSGGVRNRNGRIYAIEDLVREIKCARTLELLRTKNLFCEAGHPIDTSLQRQSTIDWRNSNCKILTLENVGNNIEGEFTPSNTELGKAFALDLLEGVIPAFSLRALGSIRQTRLGAQVTDLRFITYDQVIYPSHSNAYMTNLVNESAGEITESVKVLFEGVNSNMIIPIEPLNESDIASITSFVQNNSNNLKYINDYFNTHLSNIIITPNGSKVFLKENNSNNSIEVNLEYYVYGELMNYSEKIKDIYQY